MLVDGIRFNNSRQRTDHTGGGEAVETSLIDVGNVETLEVVRGGGSVLYGSDAVGGTLNIITKEAPRPDGNGLRFGGEFNSLYYANGPGLRGDGAINVTHRRFSLQARQSLERYSPYTAGSNGIYRAFLNNFGTNGPSARDITEDFLRDPEVLGTGLTGRNTMLEGRYFFND